MALTARVHLQTLFALDGQGRILSTREPNPTPGPAFALIRRADSCAWAVGAGVPEEIARELDKLAVDERPTAEFSKPPNHADDYVNLLGSTIEFGPAFEFPNCCEAPASTAIVDDVDLLLRSFAGWTTSELPERWPIMAIIEDGLPLSVCFSARISESVAEAGLETVPSFRGRGLAMLVTAAWAAAIQASGRTPIYSTTWMNTSSLAVARKLGLVACASYWSADEEAKPRSSM